MLIDDLFDRLAKRLRLSRPQDYRELSQSGDQPHPRPQRSSSDRRGKGFFKGARNIAMNQPTFVEDRHQIVQMFVAGKAALDPVLELIDPYTEPDAAVDSSARFPPPLCHPGTRIKIGDRLDNWFTDSERQWNMIWLYGPAGTGKSAVAQTFAERCVESGHLGASFFFSRPNNRNDPDTVIPTLVYQLAVCNPDYKSALTAQLASDPQLLRKARHIQFNRLIVDPLLQLQTQRRKRIQKPLLVILDGLDECKGESAQREIIEMISEATLSKKDFPLLWLVCSRPEAHLKYIFSRPDFTVNCGREELVIDAESIADVDLYIRDGLAGIKGHFGDTTTSTWPPQEQITRLSEEASGHFGFASTALRYIGDETFATPMARFDRLLCFLEGDRIKFLDNPLEALDALYAGILRDIPDGALHLVKRILARCVLVYGDSAQFFCNLLSLDQTTFYGALRKLHSVIDVPTPEAGPLRFLGFYHTSFRDYLEDPRRSSNFINMDDAWVDCAKTYLSWYKIDLELFHTADGFIFNGDHQHGVLPGLKWVSEGNEMKMSVAIASEAAKFCWWPWGFVRRDDALLSQVRSFDFRYIKQDDLDYNWQHFANNLWEVDSSSGFIRTEPQHEVDHQLLEYMEAVTKPGESVKPAQFPLGGNVYGNYFLLGHDSTTIVCWTTGLNMPRFAILNCNEPPSKEQIDAHQALFVNGDDKNSTNKG